MLLGLCIFVTGVVILLEQLGVMSFETRWLLPIALICYGLDRMIKGYKRGD